MKLKKYISENDVKEITIIGGSHSGFSCAWLMIHGNATFGYGKQGQDEIPTTRKFE